MIVRKGRISGIYILEPRIFKDPRGYFFESYNKRVFEREIGKVNWVQDNESASVKNVFRGFHYQLPPYAQAKLVRVTKGKVLDLALDIRPGSSTFGQVESLVLSEENKLQFFIPHGFAHGYLVLSETAVFNYKCDNYYAPEAEGGVKYDDSELGISWPAPLSDMTVSEKDKNLPNLKDHKPFR